MECPTCAGTALVMSDRQGLEIDYCPKCRGVWLDRGELDKLIERSTTEGPAARSPPRFGDSGYDQGRGLQGHRKKSWLKDIFD